MSKEVEGLGRITMWIQTFPEREIGEFLYSNVPLICDYCGAEVYDADEYLALNETQNRRLIIRLCHLGDNQFCTHQSKRFLQLIDPNIKLIYLRPATYSPAEPIARLPSSQSARQPITPSIRYQVMARDGFKCVLCGNSGADARLEIDHIHPVSAGGGNEMDNLRTLCFECNRGKGAKIEEVDV